MTPWPAALHDSRHSGASTATGPKTGTVRWRRKLEGAVTAGPVIGQDGTIYAASNGGVLHALDAATGADRWTYDSGHTEGGDLSISPLVLPDRTVLWPTPGAELVALSPTGTPLWSQPLPGQPTSPASVDGHRIYVGDLSGAVSALDVMGASGHRLVWTVHACCRAAPPAGRYAQRRGAGSCTVPNSSPGRTWTFVGACDQVMIAHRAVSTAVSDRHQGVRRAEVARPEQPGQGHRDLDPPPRSRGAPSSGRQISSLMAGPCDPVRCRKQHKHGGRLDEERVLKP